MGKFKDFYIKLQEEKLLKIKETEKKPSGDLTEPSKSSPVLNDLLKKEDEQTDSALLQSDPSQTSNDGILQKQEDDKFPVAKPVFNGIQKRNELSTTQDDTVSETVNYSTKMLDAYPTEPINLGNSRLIKTPESNKDTEGTYGYDVTISPKQNLFSFLQSPTLFQLNENGVMRFQNDWDDVAIKREVKKLAKKKDKEDEDNLYKLVTYLQTQNKSNLEVIEEFFNNMTDYYLFWKFDDEMNSLKREDYISDEEFQEARDRVQQRIDDLKNKPSEEDVDKYIQSQEFYNVLKKMGIAERGLGTRALQILRTISEPKYTYFYPTLIDVIRIYDECATSVKELPTVLVKKIDSNDENNPFVVKESLYTDVLLSNHQQRGKDGNPIKGSKPEPYTKTNPQNTAIFTNEFGKDLGKIVYEFKSVKAGNWNRITDKGVLIGYGPRDSFTSVDIHTCYIMAYCDLAENLKEVTTYNTKYKNPDSIQISLLKTCLDNVVTKKVAADHGGSLNDKKRTTRRFFI